MISPGFLPSCYNLRERETKMLRTHVSDLTVDELKALVRETVEETLAEFLADPDKGLALRESMKAALKRSTKAVREGSALYSADEVAKDLRLQ
jgi:hypothetical protein